jgi:uncharacterized iron-regulated membrane protein
VNHGIVEVFAYQETLLIMAVFGIAILLMIWVGFRRWLQHKETMSRVTAEHLQQVDARLEALEQIVSGGLEPAPRIDAARAGPLPDHKSET